MSVRSTADDAQMWPEGREEKQVMVHACSHGALVRNGWMFWNKVTGNKYEVIPYTYAYRAWVHGKGVAEMTECCSLSSAPG